MFAAAETGEFAGGLVGLGTAVAEEGLAAKADLAEALGVLDLGLVVIDVADVPEVLGLLLSGFDEGGMAMAQDSAAEAGEEVEIFFAVGIPDFGAAPRTITTGSRP